MCQKNQRATAILATINAIPSGRVATYGQIAKHSGYPGNARYVGQLLKNLPEGSTIPWHRVINSQGRSAFPSCSEQYKQQVSALEQEGIVLPLNKAQFSQSLWP